MVVQCTCALCRTVPVAEYLAKSLRAWHGGSFVIIRPCLRYSPFLQLSQVQPQTSKLTIADYKGGFDLCELQLELVNVPSSLMMHGKMDRRCLFFKWAEELRIANMLPKVASRMG